MTTELRLSPVDKRAPKIVRLGDASDLISSGSTPLGGDKNYAPTGPVMFVRSQNVQMTKLDLSDVAYVSDEIHQAMKRTHLKCGDVLLNITGASIGRVAPFLLENIKANVNQHVCIIRPKSGVLDPQYLARFMSTPRFQADIDRLQRGGTRQALTFSQIADFLVPVPPLKEQQRIVEILNAAEQLRIKRFTTIEDLEKLAQSIFLEFFADTLESPHRTPLRELVSEFRYGSSTKSGPSGYPILRIPNVVSGGIHLDDVKFVDLGDSEFRRLQLLSGDLLFVRTNGNPDFVGRCAVYQPEQFLMTEFAESDFVFASYLIRARLKDSLILPIFLQKFFESDEGRMALRRGCKTSAGQYNINTETLGSIPVPVPPLQQQRTFVAQIDACNQLRRTLDSSLAQIENLFLSLQQRAFNGGIGV